MIVDLKLLNNDDKLTIFIVFFQNNDIALVQIKEKVTKIKPIALPIDAKKDYAGQLATTIGWGTTKAGEIQQTSSFQKISVEKYKNVGKYLSFPLNFNQVEIRPKFCSKCN